MSIARWTGACGTHLPFQVPHQGMEPGHAWRGAYHDEAGKQRIRSFQRQFDAKRWITILRAMGCAPATTTLSTKAHLRPSAEDKTRAAAYGMAAAVLATSLPHIDTEQASYLGK